MRIKNYYLIIAFLSVTAYTASAQQAQTYLFASASVVTPTFKFASHPDFYSNVNNSFGDIGYAETGPGATLGLTSLFADGVLGLSAFTSYGYNSIDVTSYTEQVSMQPGIHYKPVSGTGYKHLTLVGGITLEPYGKNSAFDIKALAGILLCYTPTVTDSGHTDYYQGYMQPSGPTTVEAGHGISFVWGAGMDVRLPISEHILLLVSTDFMVSNPEINTTVQTTYLDQLTLNHSVETTNYRYYVWVSTLAINVGVSYKL